MHLLTCSLEKISIDNFLHPLEGCNVFDCLLLVDLLLKLIFKLNFYLEPFNNYFVYAVSFATFTEFIKCYSGS